MGTRIVIFLVGFLMLTFGVLLVAWSTQTAWSFQWRMRQGEPVRTDARVEDFRTLTNDRTQQVTHELRYVFKVPGDDTEYLHDDDIWFIEQTEGWVDVPEDLWERSRDSGEIPVEYLEGDPSVNQPVGARRGLGSVILFGLLGLVSTAIGALLVFRRPRRQAKPVETPSPIQG